jgi:Fe-S-cluster containining protein
MGRNNQAKRKAKKRKKAAKERRRLPIAASSASARRACDGCTACCSVFGVEEIDKKPWVPCEHLNDRGCSVYETRPKMCHEFYCLWQSGLGPDSTRPDKLGVVFAITKGVLESTGCIEAQAYEIEPGAFERPAVVMVARELARKRMLIIGHTHGGKTLRFMGPKDKIEKAKNWKPNKVLKDG